MKQRWIVLFAILAACVMPASSEPLYPTASVYINGQALTSEQEAELAQLVGEPVPAGRYILDNDGMFGFEGRTERVNLAARRQGGDTMMTDGRGSTMVGYGDCVSMTTPSGTFMGGGC